MHGLGHHLARQQNGITHIAHAGHGARVQGSSVHDRGVQLVLTLRVEYRAPAGVKKRGILEDGDRPGDGVQRAAAGFQYRVAGSRGFFQLGADFLLVFRREVLALDGAGAGVDRNRYRPAVLACRGHYRYAGQQRHDQQCKQHSFHGFPPLFFNQ